jgi:glycosyltransferase involved in cell wall biosynthesis
LKYQNQEKLKLLYQKTYALLFPSLYESFGIPLVDALQNNCQIIASSRGAPQEICGKNAYYFDPKNSKELISKLFILKKKFPEVNYIKYPEEIIYNTWNKSINKIIKIINNNF